MISDFFELIGVQPNHTHRSYSELSRRPVARRRQSCRRHGTRHRVNPAYLREWGFPRPIRFLATLRARGPYPLLAISGEQGSAKTVMSKILKALIDPSAAPVRALPREERELMIAANNGYLLAFDNLCGLPAWLSDALCRLASGGIFAVRQLHTDGRGRSPGRLHLRKHGRLAIVRNIPRRTAQNVLSTSSPALCGADGSTQTLPDRRGAGRSRCSTRERHARYVEHQKNWQNNLETMDAPVHAGNNCRRSGEYIE